MSADKHTAEPWAQFIDRRAGEISLMPAGRPGTIAMLKLADNGDANARRIWAAIHAVAGIPTEALEEAARFADGWHRLGCLRDLCEIERAAQHLEPRPR